MHLFIVAPSKLIIPSAILEATMINVLNSCAGKTDINVVIIGFPFSENINMACQELQNVSFVSNKEAGALIRKVNQASVLHFGDNVKWAQNIPLYFMPLVLPSEMLNLPLWKRLLYKKAFNKWLKKATKMIVSSDWAMSNLQQNYPGYIDKIQIVHLPLKSPNILEWTELSAAKEEIANGNNYFLFFAPLERLVPIVKEFSIFKKWQQTTMNLVFVLENQQQVTKALILLNGYKFKNDVILYTADEVRPEWLAASYAILWEGVYATISAWIINAIQFDIPMLFDDKIQLPTSWLKAGEVFSFRESQMLSNHFKLYYKDEMYRQSRARIGKEWLESINQLSAQQELFNNIVLSHIK
jgi:hypothetical protein